MKTLHLSVRPELHLCTYLMRTPCEARGEQTFHPSMLCTAYRADQVCIACRNTPDLLATCDADTRPESRLDISASTTLNSLWLERETSADVRGRPGRSVFVWVALVGHRIDETAVPLPSGSHDRAPPFPRCYAYQLVPSAQPASG